MSKQTMTEKEVIFNQAFSDYFEESEWPDATHYCVNFKDDIADDERLNAALRDLGYSKIVYDDDNDPDKESEYIQYASFLNRLSMYNPVRDMYDYGFRVATVFNSYFQRTDTIL